MQIGLVQRVPSVPISGSLPHVVSAWAMGSRCQKEGPKPDSEPKLAVRKIEARSTKKDKCHHRQRSQNYSKFHCALSTVSLEYSSLPQGAAADLYQQHVSGV